MGSGSTKLSRSKVLPLHPETKIDYEMIEQISKLKPKFRVLIIKSSYYILQMQKDASKRYIRFVCTNLSDLHFVGKISTLTLRTIVISK